ncbi:MAG TPA: histidine phosphatase family protein [Longimicrobium sp.]|jgi:probable phosphoglycerate mutase|uniref:histidine phosphatase family protein n=1 Tax=Longimicrobium sp. TaxID=2029185 RepID=UPI002ED8B9E5
MPPPLTRVFLVRHGATVLTAEDRFAGAVDVPLSDEGQAQAAGLSRRLAATPIHAAYASPLGRAMETAAIVTRGHAVAVTPLPALREISHGRWEEMTRAEVQARYADEAERWDADPYTFAPEGGESGLQVTARALPAVLDLVRAHPDQTVLVVSHKATIRLILSSLLGFDPRRYRDNLDQSPAALNVVDFRGPTRARLTLFNDTSHYEQGGLALPAVPAARLSPWWCVDAGAAGDVGVRWDLWRQDDNGNRVRVADFATRAEADARMAEFESRHPEQTYWVAPAE